MAPGPNDKQGKWVGGNAAAGHQGLLSILTNNNAGQVTVKADSEEVSTVVRYLIKREDIMQRLIEVIFGISDDLQGLVTVDVGESIQINFGGVRDLVEKLIADVKHFIEKMRPFVPAKDLYPYERKENPGSIYWLEEHLMEKLFIGREPVSTDVAAEGAKAYVSLNDTVRVLNNTYQRLTCSWNVDGADFNNAIANAKVRVGNANTRHGAGGLVTKDHYDVEICQLAYYSPLQTSPNVQANNTLTAANANGDVEMNDGTAGGSDMRGSILEYLRVHKGNNIIQPIMAHDGYILELHNTSTNIRMNPRAGGSILFTFNRILENYLATFTDRISDKVYRGVLENIANGVLNSSVSDPVNKTWPDHDGGVRFADPKPTCILFGSLAIVMRNLMNEKDKSEKKLRYVEESLSEISLHMKEKYRTFMPIYKTTLYELIKKAELLRKLILQNGGDKLSMVRDTTTQAPVAAPGACLIRIPGTGIELNTHVAKVLAAVIEASTGLMGCIDQVLRELGDEPRYMETRMNSLADFKSMNNKEPITPLSNLLHVMKQGNDLLQLEKSQGPEFKFQYGTRAVLARPDIELQPEHLPHVNQLYDMYNSVLSGRDQLDMNRVKEFNGRLIRTMRWIHETKNIKNQLAVADNTVGVIAIPGAAATGTYNTPLPTAYLLHDVNKNPIAKNEIEADARLAKQILAGRDPANGRMVDTLNERWRLTASISTHVNNDIKASYAIAEDVGALVDITENSLRKEKLQSLAKYVYGSKGGKKDLVMQNIVDMNVVPINIHAFMREMPLANIYNYSYTFERLIVELFYGMNEPEIRDEMLTALCHEDRDTELRKLIRSPKDLFIAMLIDPYMELTSHGLYELMRKLFRGESAMELDRPKYLSDQVFNKVLFDQLYAKSLQGEIGHEMGPPAQRYLHRPMAGRNLVAQNPPATELPLANPAMRTRGTTAAMNTASFVASAHDSLTYLPSEQVGQSRANYQAIQNTNVGDVIDMLRATGLLRFDTRLVRNLIFLVNLYRVIRLKLRKDLMYDRNIILKSHSVAREDATEHIRNDRWTPRDYPPGSRMSAGTRAEVDI